MISATQWLSQTTALHASVGHGFRIPTYLDLYYSDPTTLGNPNLKPESAWNFDAGVSWYPRPDVAATITAFYSRQHDTIDYTRASEADPWQASNLPGVRFKGVEASVTWQPKSTQRFLLGWTNLVGAQSALHGLQSEYVFNYPVNNARMEWAQQISRQAVLNTRMGVVERFGRSTYAVWDLSLARQAGRLRPYLHMTNLTNTGYEEILGVRMPPRGFAGGLEVVLTNHGADPN
jgi:iron complex outermembrane receptor protein